MIVLILCVSLFCPQKPLCRCAEEVLQVHREDVNSQMGADAGAKTSPPPSQPSQRERSIAWADECKLEWRCLLLFHQVGVALPSFIPPSWSGVAFFYSTKLEWRCLLLFHQVGVALPSFIPPSWSGVAFFYSTKLEWRCLLLFHQVGVALPSFIPPSWSGVAFFYSTKLEWRCLLLFHQAGVALPSFIPPRKAAVFIQNDALYSTHSSACRLLLSVLREDFRAPSGNLLPVSPSDWLSTSEAHTTKPPSFYRAIIKTTTLSQ